MAVTYIFIYHLIDIDLAPIYTICIYHLYMYIDVERRFTVNSYIYIDTYTYIPIWLHIFETVHDV